ncbi:hypothetical protein E5676_scaffold595G00530 [Cucumis melo var. makuwa]|uniref:Chromo domain-containing protein n=1 Tax=Cucumis melo var. makuwa TaxID=1194695 RepID=A0A5D3E3U9_CUCMM|nr:hypothetical protein E6C27_scaffold550G00850 [Cucumis melo var. makuwa]TYK30230.1 hypothetical protein E5676_scaffold595G00530 [Cucumis melo var. makuwa]
MGTENLIENKVLWPSRALLRHFTVAFHKHFLIVEGPVSCLSSRQGTSELFFVHGVPPIIDLSQKEDKDVEEILAERVRRGRRPTRRIHEYLVKWKNLLVEETSWERVEDLKRGSRR